MKIESAFIIKNHYNGDDRVFPTPPDNMTLVSPLLIQVTATNEECYGFRVILL